MREKLKNMKWIIISALILVVLIAVGVSVKASGNTSGIAKSVTFTDNMDGAYVYFRAVDAAGNVGEWSEPQRLWIDNTAPTVTANENSVTIKEGDVNALADYFTVVANGSNDEVDVVCTIGGTTYTTTETLTVEGSPYTVVCTATKSGGKSGNATITILVENSLPEEETILFETEQSWDDNASVTLDVYYDITIPDGVNVIKVSIGGNVDGRSESGTVVHIRNGDSGIYWGQEGVDASGNRELRTINYIGVTSGASYRIYLSDGASSGANEVWLGVKITYSASINEIEPETYDLK